MARFNKASHKKGNFYNTFHYYIIYYNSNKNGITIAFIIKKNTLYYDKTSKL